MHIAASVDTGLMDECLEAHSSGVRLSAFLQASGTSLRLLSARGTASGIADLWIELEELQLAFLATLENPEESAEIVHQFPTTSTSEPSFSLPFFL